MYGERLLVKVILTD